MAELTERWWRPKPASKKKAQTQQATGWRGDPGRAPRTVFSPTIAPAGWQGDIGAAPRTLDTTAATKAAVANKNTGQRGDLGLSRKKDKRDEPREPWWQAGTPGTAGLNLEGLQLAGLTEPAQTLSHSYTLTPVQVAANGMAGGPVVVNPASMAPASIELAPRNAAPGWIGDLGYAPRTTLTTGTVGARDMSQQFPAPTTGFGTTYDWWRKRGGGGRGGYSNYTPAWMLALNQWNYGE